MKFLLKIFNITIQLGVLIYIALTFHNQAQFNKRQVQFNENQNTFNINQIRPWIKIEIKDDYLYLVDIADTTFCRLYYRCKNLGNTPAINLSTSTFIIDTFYNKDYIISKLKFSEENDNFNLYPHDSTVYIYSSSQPIYSINMSQYYTKKGIVNLTLPPKTGQFTS